MKILAVDPATKSGWAHSSGESGVWDFSLKKDESSGVKFMKLRNELFKILLKLGIDLVVYEAPRGFGFHTALVSHSKFAGVIEEFCASQGIQHKSYVATEIKKHATLDGKASKEDMISRAEFKWGKVIDDNHADALWLLDLAKKEFGKDV